MMRETNRRDFLKMISGGIAAFSTLSASAYGRRSKVKKPNFIFFLVDDLGYMDTGAYNPSTFYETPNIDRLAKEGMRFTNAYAANPVCSPTRYSVMTGRYPSRVGATNYFPGKKSGRFLPAELNDFMPQSETTIAEAMKSAGYRTAIVGKWHLGKGEKYAPTRQGFELDPKLSERPKYKGMEEFADATLRILEQYKNDPFFLYLPFVTVHIPILAPYKLVRKYETKAAKLKMADPCEAEFAIEEQVWQTDEPRIIRIRQSHAGYAAEVEDMDTQVGRVLAKVKELGLEENTIIIFMSDNGGLCSSEGMVTSNRPLRGGKGWLYEGGIREPMIIKWPGVVKAGSICHEPVISTDFYPTMLDMAGLPLKPNQHLDGVSITPLLKGKESLDRDALFWHYPHYSNQGGFPGGAIRMGDFKLIERFEDGRVHLYNLKEDIGEQTDLADLLPQKVKKMRLRLHAWYKEVDAKFLRAKPNGPQPWRPTN